MSNRFGDGIKWTEYGDSLLISGRGIIKKPPVPEKQWKKVVIADGIRGIDHSAFAGFISLEEVELPKTLMTIGEYAFADCWNLKKIGPLPSLNFIEKNAFDHSGCHTLAKALEEAGPTLVPYSNRIYTQFGDIRATADQRNRLNGLGIYDQLKQMHFGITGDPFSEEAQEYEDLVFTDLYKIIMDGNYIIGVVLQDAETKKQTWLFTNISSWENTGNRFIRLEMK
jgi:hypothetical protein